MDARPETRLAVTPLERAILSLHGLSVGDALGGCAERAPVRVQARRLPEPVWRWSDDTHMALSVLENLAANGGVDQDSLARSFADRYAADPRRGYGHGARRLLARIATRPWREAALELFDGGSYGNGAAMRAAPAGAWFAGDVHAAVHHGTLQSAVTHAHPDGIAGGVAVAVAASLYVTGRAPSGVDFLRAVLAHVPPGETAVGIRRAMDVPAGALAQAARQLGTGQRISSRDTVPYCLWCVAHHSSSFEEAMWTTISFAADGDTTCAIVGGIIGPRHPPPPAWIEAREPLPTLRLASC